jgi:hypothetical protein
MTRSRIWLGVGVFAFAMMLTIGIDPFGRNIGMTSISLGGLPAFAQLSIELPDPADVVESLVDGDKAGDADDDDDDDDPAADKEGDDN